MADKSEQHDTDLELTGSLSEGVAGEASTAMMTNGGTPVRPQDIGPYRLLEQIGEGGMGQVWLAEQTEPVKRQVAVRGR